jgi:hypothetical protein
MVMKITTSPSVLLLLAAGFAIVADRTYIPPWNHLFGHNAVVSGIYFPEC